MVSRLLKGIFHERPPQPRYSEMWDVSKVTSYIESQGENDTLSLTDLTHKIAVFSLGTFGLALCNMLCTQ